MTPTQIIAAHKAVLELCKTVLPFSAARQLARLKKQLDEEVNTIHDGEVAIVEKHGGKINQLGDCDFPSPENATSFVEERQEYFKQDDETIQLPVVDLSKYTSVIRLTAESVEALDGIVNFGENTNGGQDDR